MASTLVHFGTSEQGQRWALPILRGELTAALVGLHDRGQARDATADGFSVDRDKDELVVGGYGICDQDAMVMMVLAKVGWGNEHDADTVLLMLPSNTAGVIRKPLRHGDCQRVFVTGARVSDDCLVGPQQDGWAVLRPALEQAQSLAWVGDVDRLVEIAEVLRPANAEQRQRLATLVMDVHALRLLGVQTTGFGEPSRAGVSLSALLATDAIHFALDLATTAAHGDGLTDPVHVFGAGHGGGAPPLAGRFARTVHNPPVRTRTAIADDVAASLVGH